MRRVRLGPLIASALMGCVVAAAGLVAPAYADEDVEAHTALSLTGLTDVAVDDGHGWVYVAGATSDDHLVAIKPDGSQARDIPLAGATNLAVSEDGSRLAASIPFAHEIAVVDTATDEITMYPDQGCPAALAIVGAKVWFADTCDGGFTRLHDLDLTTGAGGYEFSYPVGYDHDPVIYGIPGTHEVLVYGCCSGANVSVFDGDTNQLIAQVQGSLSATQSPVVFGPDPNTVWLGSQEYHLPDLAPLGTLQLSVPAWQFLAANESYLLKWGDAVGFQVLDRASTTLLNTIQFGPDANGDVQRLLFAQGSLLAFLSADGVMQMYEEPTPGLPAPTLTAQVEKPVVIGHLTTLSGTLTQDSAPVAGAEIDVTDALSGETLGAVVTDSTGAWSLNHTWDVAGTDWLRVSAPGDGSRKSAVTRLGVDVDKLTAALGLVGPATVSPGTTVVVHGTLTADSMPLPDKILAWRAPCTGYQPSTPSGTLTTGDDGSYTISYDPQRCLHTQLHVEYGGDDRVNDQDETFNTDVSWHLADPLLDMPSMSYVGDGASGTVSVLLDGSPAAGVPVHIQVSEPGSTDLDLSGTTGADGSLQITFATPVVGSYVVHAQVDDTDTTLGGASVRTVDVWQVPSNVSVQIPDNDITAGQSVVIEGFLTHDDGSSTPGSTIDVTAHDSNGQTRNLTASTQADGSWQLTDSPPVAGFTEYTVSYQGDAPRYAAWTGSFTGYVQVRAIQPTVTLQADRSTYDAGDKVALHVDLTDSASRQVTVVATQDGAQPVTLFAGPVPDGGLTIHPSVMANETFTATTPADDKHSGAQATVSVRARLVLETFARNPQAWQGATAVYAAGKSPLFPSHLVAPSRTNVELRFVVQRQTTSGWRTVVTSARSPLGATGWTSWRFTRPHRTGVGYRVRTHFPGDSSNVASHSPWVSFRFSRS